MVTTRPLRRFGPTVLLSATTPSALEVLEPSRADWVGLDLPHGALDPAAAGSIIRVCEGGGVLTLVRLAEVSPPLGCHRRRGGQSRRTKDRHGRAGARHCAHRPHPTARRNFAGNLSAGQGGPHTVEPSVLAMVESEQALAENAAIIEVDGLDGVFVEPYDLSLSLGATTDDPPLTSSVERPDRPARRTRARVRDVCRRHCPRTPRTSYGPRTPSTS